MRGDETLQAADYKKGEITLQLANISRRLIIWQRRRYSLMVRGQRFTANVR